MLIKVKLPRGVARSDIDGRLVKVKVKRSDTVFLLKDKLYGICNWRATQPADTVLRLFKRRGGILFDCDAISDCGLEHGSTVCADLARIPMYGTIFVMSTELSSLIISVDRRNTIKQLKEKISDKLSISPRLCLSGQRLLVSTYELEDDRRFMDCEIYPYQTVHLLMRMRGGGEPRHLLSQSLEDCPSLSAPGSQKCLSQSPLMSKHSEVRKIIKLREDMWYILCKAFNIGDYTVMLIEGNSDEPFIRFADTVYYMYHLNAKWVHLTWQDIMAKVKTVDIDLAEVIEHSGLTSK